MKIPHGYVKYITWNAIQDLSTQLRSVVATQRVLEGVGVGRADATAISASINFIIRDGAGMAASLLFTALSASNFRYDVKRWRLFADLIVDIGITLEVAATLVPKALFLPMICLGSMCKAMCGVSAGACGGAIELYWAEKGSDISDINAKFRAQNTVTGMLGLICSGIFAHQLSASSVQLMWCIYSLLTALHIYANVQCMKLLELNSFNTNRINIVLSDYFSHLDRFQFFDDKSQPIDHNTQVSVLSPSEVAKLEPLFFLLRRKKTLSSFVVFGVSFNNLMQSCTSLGTNLKSVFDHDQAYIVKASRKEAKRNGVYVSLKSDASSIDKTKAYFHALLLTYMMQKYAPVEDAKILEIEERANTLFGPLFTSFFEESQRAGWNLSKTDVNSRGYGFTFSREIC